MIKNSQNRNKLEKKWKGDQAFEFYKKKKPKIYENDNLLIGDNKVEKLRIFTKWKSIKF